MQEIKIDIGCGRMKEGGFIGIDRVQIIDGNGVNKVDLVLDLEKDKLPYEDNSISEIKAKDFFEHIQNLRHIFNECHRVLKPKGTLTGHVPICGTLYHYKDPTHLRCFIKETFTYFSGKSNFMKNRPSHPKYADYEFLPWDIIELKEYELRDGKNQLIEFKMTPQKEL